MQQVESLIKYGDKVQVINDFSLVWSSFKVR